MGVALIVNPSFEAVYPAEADGLLDRVGDPRRVVLHLLPLVGVAVEQHRRVGDRLGDGLAAGRDRGPHDPSGH